MSSLAPLSQIPWLWRFRRGAVALRRSMVGALSPRGGRFSIDSSMSALVGCRQVPQQHSQIAVGG